MEAHFVAVQGCKLVSLLFQLRYNGWTAGNGCSRFWETIAAKAASYNFQFPIPVLPINPR